MGLDAGLHYPWCGAVRCGAGAGLYIEVCGVVRAPALDDGAVRCGCGPLHCGAVRSRAKLLGPRRALVQILGITDLGIHRIPSLISRPPGADAFHFHPIPVWWSFSREKIFRLLVII